MYRPSEANQMTTPLCLMIPKGEPKRINGVLVKEFEDADGLIMANFKTYGGTERTVNDVLVIEDTADVVTWFRPDIKASCRVRRLTDGAIYDIIGEPENIEQRNMILKFKIKRVKGGA